MIQHKIQYKLFDRWLIKGRLSFEKEPFYWHRNDGWYFLLEGFTIKSKDNRFDKYRQTDII